MRPIAAIAALAATAAQAFSGSVAEEKRISRAEMNDLFLSAPFAPTRGYEFTLARNGANTYHAKPKRAKRLNQASAHARRRMGL